MLLPFIPPLFVMVILQLVMGQIAAVALHERNPEINVAYYQETRSGISDKYIEALSGVPDFTLYKAESLQDKTNLFDSGRIHVFVVIPKSFDASVTDGLIPAITLYVAPGIADYSIVKDHLTSQWLILRALTVGAEYLGEPIDIDAASGNAIVFATLNYEGELIQSGMHLTPPAFGIPALFLLTAFLHSAGFSVGADNLNWIIRGRKTLRIGNLFSLLSLHIFWGCAIIAYALGMRFIYRITLLPPVLLSLFGLCSYALSVGSLLSLVGKRSWAPWIFVPCLLLNMTLGGGLWNTGGMDPILPILLPVSAVLSSASGDWLGTILLWAQTAAAIITTTLIASKAGKITRKS